MSEAAQISGELKDIHSGNAWHGPSLLDVLNGISAEQAAARPLPNAHSIWEIVSHITGWENVFRLRLEGTPAVEPEEGDFPPAGQASEEDWQLALAKLEDTHERLLNVVANLSDSGLDEMVAGRDYSVRFMLHGIVRHHVYHAGQVALLCKAFA
jgi:uncharacterized damage-inducible protein DinB